MSDKIEPKMKIVAFAYACIPERGSEPGAGWMWARMLGRLGETWVITRKDYQEAIERALPNTPERDNLRFVYVELSPRWRKWQKDLRGLRTYYVLWQIAALRKARKLHKEIDFDLSWHLTWANIWMGALGALTGPTFILGPVGGCVGAVWRLVPHLGVKGAGYEVVRAIGSTYGRYVNPFARLAWRRADLILAQNNETKQWLPRAHRDKVRVFPNAAVEALVIPGTKKSGRPPTLVYVGRLWASKGAYLVVRSLAHLEGWKLLICGSGPDEKNLRKLARRLGVDERIEWLGWQPQVEVFRVMKEEADLLMLPSMHEEAGFVVIEAVAAGLPVVGLDRGGVPLLAGTSGRMVSARGGARAIAVRLAEAARAAFESKITPATGPLPFSLDMRAKALEALIHSELGTSPAITREVLTS